MLVDFFTRPAHHPRTRLICTSAFSVSAANIVSSSSPSRRHEHRTASSATCRQPVTQPPITPRTKIDRRTYHSSSVSWRDRRRTSAGPIFPAPAPPTSTLSSAVLVGSLHARRPHSGLHLRTLPCRPTRPRDHRDDLRLGADAVGDLSELVGLPAGGLVRRRSVLSQFIDFMMPIQVSFGAVELRRLRRRAGGRMRACSAPDDAEGGAVLRGDVVDAVRPCGRPAAPGMFCGSDGGVAGDALARCGGRAAVPYRS